MAPSVAFVEIDSVNSILPVVRLVSVNDADIVIFFRFDDEPTTDKALAELTESLDSSRWVGVIPGSIIN